MQKRLKTKIYILILTVVLMVTFTCPAYAADNEMAIMLTGDVMSGYEMQYACYDGQNFNFDPSFRYVKKIFQKADFVVGNLETNISESMPLSMDLNRVQDKPALNGPKEYLRALMRAGFDGFIMANNHNIDYGVTGIKETLAAVDEVGFKHTGLYDSKKDKHYFMIKKNGIKVAVVAYAYYCNEKEKFLTKDQQSYMISRVSEKQVKADVEAAKKAGAEYIIGYLHCGTEYTTKVGDRQKTIATMMANCGVDYIIGSHPHVLQETGYVTTDDGKRVPVIYSMGNFIGSIDREETRETVILQVNLKKDGWGNVKVNETKYIPCYVSDWWNEDQYVIIPQGYEKTDAALTASVKKHYKNIKKVLKIK